MTDEPVGIDQLSSPEGLSFREALTWRRWHSSPRSRARVTGAMLALLLLVPVHVVVSVLADHPWSLLALVANPASAYTFLRGWAHRDVVWMGVGVVLAFVGNFLPFYLM